MAIDIRKGSHKVAFLSKVAASNVGSPHVFNITLENDHDNGDLVVRDVTAWESFDNYAEDTSGTITFSGVIRGKGANGGYYVEVLSVSADVVLVYNSPVSPYPEKELQDESLFYNEDGDVVQGISLIRGDIVELSANAFTGTIVDGATVVYNSSTKKYDI